jgi:hypothetical protein
MSTLAHLYSPGFGHQPQRKANRVAIARHAVPLPYDGNGLAIDIIKSNGGDPSHAKVDRSGIHHTRAEAAEEARLTVWAEAQRLASGYFCQTRVTASYIPVLHQAVLHIIGALSARVPRSFGWLTNCG